MRGSSTFINSGGDSISGSAEFKHIMTQLLLTETDRLPLIHVVTDRGVSSCPGCHGDNNNLNHKQIKVTAGGQVTFDVFPPT